MERPELKALAAAASLVVGLSGCLGGDDVAETERRRADDYTVAVERVTDDVAETSAQASDTLSDVRERALAGNAARRGGTRGARRSATRSARRLDDLARRVEAAQARLDRLRAPARVEGSSDDLVQMVGDLEDAIESAGTDVKLAVRFREDLFEVALCAGRVVRAHFSGVSGLSRAVRALAGGRGELRQELDRRDALEQGR